MGRLRNSRNGNSGVKMSWFRNGCIMWICFGFLIRFVSFHLLHLLHLYVNMHVVIHLSCDVLTLRRQDERMNEEEGGLGLS